MKIKEYGYLDFQINIRLNFLINLDFEAVRIEISALFCFANHWIGFYTIGTSVMRDLKQFKSEDTPIIRMSNIHSL